MIAEIDEFIKFAEENFPKTYNKMLDLSAGFKINNKMSGLITKYFAEKGEKINGVSDNEKIIELNEKYGFDKVYICKNLVEFLKSAKYESVIFLKCKKSDVKSYDLAELIKLAYKSLKKTGKIIIEYESTDNDTTNIQQMLQDAGFPLIYRYKSVEIRPDVRATRYVGTKK